MAVKKLTNTRPVFSGYLVTRIEAQTRTMLDEYCARTGLKIQFVVNSVLADFMRPAVQRLRRKSVK